MAVVNDILSNVAMDESVIPVGISSFVEAFAYVAEEADYDFGKLLESIEVKDDEAVQEAAVINEAAGEAAVTFFQNMWGAIKAWFDKVYEWFAKRAKDAKDAIEKAVDDTTKKALKKAVDGLNDEIVDAAIAKEGDKAYKVHNWKLGGDNSTGANLKRVLAQAQNMQNQAKEIDDEKINGIPAKLVGADKQINVSEMKKQFAASLGADEVVTKKLSEFKADYKNMTNFVLKNGYSKDIKEMYNGIRMEVKNAIKVAQTAAKNPKEKESGNAAAYASVIKFEKVLIQCTHAICAVSVDCAKQKVGEDLRVLMALKRIGTKALAQQEKGAKKEESATESVEAQSIFAW